MSAPTKMAAARCVGPAQASFAGAARDRATIEIHDGLEAVEQEWRQLESRCPASPYQAYDWQHAYVAHALGRGEAVRVAVVRDGADGRPLMLLALVVRRRGAMTIATTIGGKHANFHLPMFCAQAGRQLPPEAVRAHLSEIGLRLRIDAFHFRNVPTTWRGQPNPLVLPGARPSPSFAYATSFADLPADAPAVRLSGSTRKKLRRKGAWLEEIGPVAVARAMTGQAAEATLDAFFALKARRMRDLGLDDPFEVAGAQAFLRAAAQPDAGGRAPVALWRLTCGARTVAVFGAACDGRRASGMINAFDTAPEIARCSPGDLLMLEVIESLRGEGYDSFDLGVGEARYKSQFCETVEPLVDLTVPVSLAGRAYACVAASAGTAKRWAKTTKPVAAAIARGRRLAASLTRPG